MHIRIDEQTATFTLLLATIGWWLAENPQYHDLAFWVGSTIVVGWAGATALYMLSGLTELMLWDYLWNRTRGEANGE